MKKLERFTVLALFVLLVVLSADAQLSGTKTVGGTSPDYPTVKAAMLALNAQGVAAPGVTFLIRGGTYTEDSLVIRTSTTSTSARIIFKPDAGATVVINVTPGSSSLPFAIKIDSTSYVTIDGSNNGTTSRDMSINAIGTNGQKGIWASGGCTYTTIKNCIVRAGATTGDTYRGIDLLYLPVTGASASNSLVENNVCRSAYFGIRAEGNSTTDNINDLIIRNNIIDSVSNSGIYTFYQTRTQIYGNDVSTLIAGTASVLGGVRVGSVSTNVRVYNNKVHDINTAATGITFMYGIYVSATQGMNSIFNNFIWNIICPDAGTNVIAGISLVNGNATVPDTVAFNTVYLTGTSTGNKGSDAFWKGNNVGAVYLVGNIFHNTRADGTTGVATAIGKASGAVLTSNNNNLYVGTPNAQHATGRIAGVAYSTIADWRTANGGDANSIVVNTPFVSATDLHIQATAPTLLDAGAIPVAGITTDIDGDARNVTTPDIGGDEFTVGPPQLSGIKTIDNTLPTGGNNYNGFTAAITALNTSGVGVGGVTFNVSAGQTFTELPPLLTATGTSAKPVLFKKSGAGAKPIILGTNGVGTRDACFAIVGGDYITIDSVDVQDNPANTTTTTQMEYGFYLLKLSATNGCQHVTIKNCAITLNKTNVVTKGIYQANLDSLGVAPVMTDPAGASSFNQFFSNTVSNTYSGIYLAGYAVSAPVELYDQNNSVGVGGGNTISNFGGGSATVYGTFAAYQNNFTIANNTITGGTGTTGSVYGLYNATGSNVDVYNNTVTITAGGTTSTIYGLYNLMGSNGTSISVNIYNNTVTGCTYPTATTGSMYLLYNSSAPLNCNIYGNTVTGNNLKGTGAMYCAYQSGGITGIMNMYNNAVTNNVKDSTGAMYGVMGNASATGVITMYGNSIHGNQATGGTIYSLYTSGGLTSSLYRNEVYDQTSLRTTGVVYGLYVSSGMSVYLYNNFVSDLKTPQATGLLASAGFYVAGGTNVHAYYNSIFLNATSSSATTFGNAGTYTATTPTVYSRNNIVINASTPGPTGGLVAAYRRSSTTLATYSSASNTNCFYAGTPSARRVIFYDGTNSDSTLAAYKSRISPADGNTISENVSFINSTTPPYNLHIHTATPTQIESGGSPVTTPIAITTDYDGNTRNAATPDIGADEFTGIGVDLSGPIITYTPFRNTGVTTSRTLTATLTDVSGVPRAGTGLPRIYWRRNSAAYTIVTGSFVSGSQYTFTFGGGVAAGDTVSYFIVAQDSASTPNVGAQPAGGAGGFTANPPAAATPSTSPSSYLVTQPALAAGDYTIGLTGFERVIGKRLTAQTFTRRVMREVPVGPEIDHKATKGIELTSGITPFQKTELREVEETYSVLMENGRPYEGPTRVLLTDVQRTELGLPDEVLATYPNITAALADLNLRGVSGPVRFLLNDTSYTTETFPLTVNVTSDSIPTAAKTITFKPNTGVTSTISGAMASGPIFKILSNYVTIDGSNTIGGTTRNLTIRNTSTTAPSVVLFGSVGTTPITNGTVKNTIVINGINSTSAAIYLSDAAVAGNPGYFNNMTIQNNNVRNAYIGVYANGGTLPQSGANVFYLQNALNDTGAIAIAYVGLYMQGVIGATVSQNDIGNFNGTGSQDDKGIWLATGTINAVVERNSIHDLNYTGTGGYGGHGVYVSAGAPSANNVIRNNMITRLSGDGWNYTTIPTDNTIGIAFVGAQSGNSAYFNSINLYGNTLNKASALSMGIYLGSGSVADMKNNLIVNRLGMVPAGLGYGAAGVFAQTNNAQFAPIDYNDYYVSIDTPGVSNIGVIATTGYQTLSTWAAASGGDAHSISANVNFVAPSNLHINTAGPSPVDGAATPIAGTTTDFDGDTRNTTTPDIGADEFTPAPSYNDPPMMIAKAATGAITVDGRMNEPEWATAKPYLKFGPTISVTGDERSVTGGALVRGTYWDPSFATVKFLRKGLRLYIGIQSADKSVGRFGDSWEGDGLFMKIKNAAGADNGEFKLYYTASDRVGASRDSAVYEPGGPFRPGFGKGIGLVNSGTVPYDTTQLDSGYTLELEIRLDSLGFAGNVDTLQAMFNIFDPDGYHRGTAAWIGPETRAFHKTWWGSEWGPAMRKIYLDPDRPYDDPAVMVAKAALGTITVDGRMNEPEWATAKPYMKFGPTPQVTADERSVTGGALVRGTYWDPSFATMKFLRKGLRLYVGIQSMDKSVGRFGDSWEGDGLFMKIKNQAGADNGEFKLYYTASDRVGASRDSAVYEPGGPFRPGFGNGVGLVNSGTIPYDTTQVDSGYTMELEIRLDSLGFAANADTLQAMFNIFDPDGYHRGTAAWVGPETRSFHKTWWGSEWGPAMRKIYLEQPPAPGWTAQTSPTALQFYSVKAVSPTVVWGAAKTGTVVRTTNGTTWTSVGGGWIGTSDVYNITAVDANIAFVTTTPTTTTYIFRTTNGGAVWDTVFSQAGGFIDAIHMYDATNGIALGDPVGGKYVILKTSNGGATWARIATEPTPGTGEASTQNDLCVFGPSNIWFGASANGKVYRSTDAGATWLTSTVPGSVAAMSVMAIWFNNAQYGIASGANGSTYTAYRSTDGGATWTTITVGTTGFNIAVGGSGPIDFWMARGTEVFRSTNRGATWTSSYTGTGTFYDVDFYTAAPNTFGWGVKDNGNIVKYFGTITGVETTNEIPKSFALDQNYPNPFNPTTTLQYALPRDARVNLSVYNILGQRVATLKDEVQNVGYYKVQWSGRNDFGSQVSSGVYFYRIEAKPTDGGDAFTSIKKMLLLK